MTMRILIVDNQTLFREGLAEIIRSRPDCELLAAAPDARTGIELASRHRPDVVLLDVRMPEMDGIDCCREITRRCPGTRVLALSGHSDWQYVRAMLHAGASGYALKDSGMTSLMTAVATVYRGKTYLDPELGSVMTVHADGETPYTRLSVRERQVAKLLSEGHTNAQIAQRLNISVKTVETHRSRLFAKLGISNLADLVRVAIREGWTEM